MPEYEPHESYDLTELTSAVHLPWRGFATWADERMPGIRLSLSNPKLGTYRHGFHSTTCSHGFGGSYPDEWHDWTVLAYELLRHTLHDTGCYPPFAILKGRKGMCEQDLGKKTIEEIAHEVIVTRGKRVGAEVGGYIRWLRGKGPPDKAWFCGKKNERLWQEAIHFPKVSTERLDGLRWCRWAMRAPLNHERAFWSMVKAAILPDLERFCHIAAAIQEGRPLDDDGHDLLIYYQQLGSLRTIKWLYEDGAIRIETVMEADWERMNAHDHEERAQALLVPIAYQLAVAWERSQPWPRYIITCHNPLCGRRFYSGRADAVTCPKSSTDLKSACKRIWDDYQKWLRKVQKDPVLDWADHGLKLAFIGQYTPRGPQAPTRRG